VIARALLLLAGVVLLLALVGKLQRPKVPPGPTRPAVQSARKCPDCGSYVLGTDPVPCERADCPYRPG
jgi:hypothetical protein